MKNKWKIISYPNVRALTDDARAEIIGKLEHQREQITAAMETKLAAMAQLTGKTELAARENKVGTAPNDNGYRVRQMAALKKQLPKGAKLL